MGEYTNDLMMAVVVAAVAFIGMTAVVYGQVAQSKLKASEKRGVFRFLTGSFFCGVVALVISVSWLTVGSKNTPSFINAMWSSLASVLLLLEMSLLAGPAFVVWGRSIEEEPPSKLAAQSKHPRKRQPAR